MSDPAEITQQAQQHTPDLATLAGWLGMLTAFLGTVAGLWRVAFGSKAEKSDALERAAEIALRNAEHADERAERADEETTRHKTALGTCEEQLATMREQQSRDRERLARLEAEHSTCGPRITAQAEQIAWMESAIDALHEGKPLPERTGSTPPPARMPKPDDVRRAAAEETGP